MKKVLLVVCVLALLSMAAAAYATNSQWVISIKAVNSTYGGGSVTQVGVGNNNETATAGFTNEFAGTIIRENTAAYGDLSTGAYHSYHDTLATADPQSYAWDLKVGAKGADVLQARIYIWNNRTAQGTKGGELNHSLAYAFQKKVGETYQTLAWFSDAALQASFTGIFADNAAGTWHDTTELIKASGAWAPSSINTGFYVTQDLLSGQDYASLADYRLVVSSPVPEPGSLMALGTGLVGLAGFAIRRRK